LKTLHDLEEQALAGGIGKPNAKSKGNETGELSSTETTIKRLFKPHQDGCSACNHTGYKGRIGIYEVLHNSEKVQRLIVSNETSEAIQTAAIEEGMLTMQLDGFVKALRGETAIAEILRVTSQE
jgi:type IV pilus assembly protein PilB